MRPDPATCCGASSRRPREPIAGGRHKVFGHPDLAIVPTTSTIASHLPRAVGLAYAIERARGGCARPGPWPASGGRRRRRQPGAGPTTRSWSAPSATPRSTTPSPRRRSTPPAGSTTPARSCRCCSSARTTAGHQRRARPPGWVEAVLRSRPGPALLRARTAATCAATYDAAGEAAAWVRRERRPAVLHLRMVRLMGHAGADAEVGVPLARRDRRRPGPRPAGRAPPAAGRGRPARARTS